jgi:hypothetical protein
MKSDDMPMWEDPTESDVVRDLLTAGRDAEVEYDVAKGLSQHLAHVQAGAPLPKWAQSSGIGGASSGTLLTWVVVPVVTASIAAAVWFSSRDAGSNQGSLEKTRPALVEVASSSPAPLAPKAHAEPVEQPVEQMDVAPASAASPTTDTADEPVPTRGRKHTVQRKLASGRAERVVGASPSVKSRIPDELPLRVESPSASSRRTAALRDDSVSATEQETVANASRQSAAQVEQPAESAQAPRQVQAEASESKLEREMQMLAVAQRVLADDPARALRMSAQGEREFGNTMFSAERKNVEALALVKLGRLDEARLVGKALLTTYPNAPFSQRLRKALLSGRVE